MMEIKEKLTLGARPGKLTLIRTGMVLKCYQQSLFSLVHSVYPDIKVTGRRIIKLGGQVGHLGSGCRIVRKFSYGWASDPDN